MKNVRMMNLLPLALLAVLYSVTGAGCTTGSTPEAVAASSLASHVVPVEVRLAREDGDAGDPAKVARFRELLTSVSPNFIETPDRIGDLLIVEHRNIWRSDITVMDMLEDFSRLFDIHYGNQRFARYAADYVLESQRGYSREGIIQNLHHSLVGMRKPMLPSLGATSPVSLLVGEHDTTISVPEQKSLLSLLP